MEAPDPEDPRKRADDGSWFAWFATLFSSDTTKPHDGGSGGEVTHHTSDAGPDGGSDSGGGDGGGGDGGGGGD